MKMFFISAILTLFLPTSLWAENRVYHYEPENVELIGTVEEQTFPGRPGYESIKNGDEIERGWYFRLLSPIDVELSKNDGDHNSKAESNVKILQLAWFPNKVVGAALPNLVGKKVELKGQLFHAFTAHHHARILMRVEVVEVVDK